MTTAASLRRQIRAREGWQTRRRARLAGLEARRRRLRRPDRIRETDLEIRALQRQIRDAERELRLLRRRLAELRREEEPPPAPPPEPPPPAPPPPPEPEPEPPAPPPAPAPPTYPQRWVMLGGGVAPLADGRLRGWLSVAPPELADPWIDPESILLDDWVRAVETAVDQLAPHPDTPDPTWRGRIWVAVSRLEEVAPSPGGERGPPGSAAEGYETDSPVAASSDLARLGRGTYSGWTADPRRLALITDLVTEALARAGWRIDAVALEAVWGGAGRLPRGAL